MSSKIRAKLSDTPFLGWMNWINLNSSQNRILIVELGKILSGLKFGRKVDGCI